MNINGICCKFLIYFQISWLIFYVGELMIQWWCATISSNSRQAESVWDALKLIIRAQGTQDWEPHASGDVPLKVTGTLERDWIKTYCQCGRFLVSFVLFLPRYHRPAIRIGTFRILWAVSCPVSKLASVTSVTLPLSSWKLHAWLMEPYISATGSDLWGRVNEGRLHRFKLR